MYDSCFVLQIECWIHVFCVLLYSKHHVISKTSIHIQSYHVSSKTVCHQFNYVFHSNSKQLNTHSFQLENQKSNIPIHINYLFNQKNKTIIHFKYYYHSFHNYSFRSKNFYRQRVFFIGQRRYVVHSPSKHAYQPSRPTAGKPVMGWTAHASEVFLKIFGTRLNRV